MKKCGGKDRCQLAYVGEKKQGKFDLVYGDGTRAVSESAAPAAEPMPAAQTEIASAEPAPEPEPQPAASASASSGSGSAWIVNGSFQGEIEDYLANARKKGKQLRALAIARDGSRIGVGLYTPKSESGWASGGGSVDSQAIVADLALKKCGGKSVCKLAYIGDKKQGSFSLAYQ